MIENLKELSSKQHSEEAVIDCAEWVSPLSLLPIAVYANNNGIKVRCLEINPEIRKYLYIIGFPYGKELSITDKRYLPITKLSCLEDSPLSDYERRILDACGKESLSLLNAIKYLTSELEDNVKQHAGVDHYWILAQYWSKTNTCEIAMADVGIGYKESYKGTKFEVQTDLEAIYNALEGRSSKPSNERGAGIPTIVKMFTEGYGGKVVIMSGNALVYYKKDEVKEYNLDFSWKGAFVGINFPVKQIEIEKYYY
ncbi:MAG: hypothetical protein ABC596_09420 [Candidatus Methanosuratincola petrocarbonis]